MKTIRRAGLVRQLIALVLNSTATLIGLVAIPLVMLGSWMIHKARKITYQ